MRAAVYFSLYFAYISPEMKNKAVIEPQNEFAGDFVFAAIVSLLFW
jgi:hypothetical protein